MTEARNTTMPDQRKLNRDNQDEIAEMTQGPGGQIAEREDARPPSGAGPDEVEPDARPKKDDQENLGLADDDIEDNSPDGENAGLADDDVETAEPNNRR